MSEQQSDTYREMLMRTELTQATEELQKQGFDQAAEVLRQFAKIRWSLGGTVGNVGHPEDDRRTDRSAEPAGRNLPQVRPHRTGE